MIVIDTTTTNLCDIAFSVSFYITLNSILITFNLRNDRCGLYFERRLWCMVKVNEMQFGFMSGKRNDRCSVYFEEVTRGVLRLGEEVVYVLH